MFSLTQDHLLIQGSAKHVNEKNSKNEYDHITWTIPFRTSHYTYMCVYKMTYQIVWCPVWPSPLSYMTSVRLICRAGQTLHLCSAVLLWSDYLILTCNDWTWIISKDFINALVPKTCEQYWIVQNKTNYSGSISYSLLVHHWCPVHWPEDQVWAELSAVTWMLLCYIFQSSNQFYYNSTDYQIIYCNSHTSDNW